MFAFKWLSPRFKGSRWSCWYVKRAIPNGMTLFSMRLAAYFLVVRRVVLGAAFLVVRFVILAAGFLAAAGLAADVFAAVVVFLVVLRVVVRFIAVRRVVFLAGVFCLLAGTGFAVSLGFAISS